MNVSNGICHNGLSIYGLRLDRCDVVSAIIFGINLKLNFSQLCLVGSPLLFFDCMADLVGQLNGNGQK